MKSRGDKMKMIYDVAMSLVGTPYVWSGKTPHEGLDCSGLVQILLEVGGADPVGDQTAHGLYKFFSQPANHNSQDPQLGALAFYGTPAKVTHVAMCLDRRRMIEAAGGGPACVLIETADRLGAFTRVVPIRFKELVGLFVPDYPAASGI